MAEHCGPDVQLTHVCCIRNHKNVKLASGQSESPNLTQEACDLPEQCRFAGKEVAAILVETLKISTAEFESDCMFRELGVDSLLSVNIVQALQETFGPRVPFSVMVDYPTVDSLVRYRTEHGSAPESDGALRRQERRTTAC